MANLRARSREAKQVKYDAILDAAVHLFVQRGYHGTSVPAVAKQAGVAAGTIYSYFESKEALVNAVFRKYKAAIAQRVQMALPLTEPARVQFKAMWKSMTDFAMSNPEAFAFLELHQHSSYLDAESRRMENQLKEFGAGFVQLAQQTGELKDMDTTLLMELIFGAFIGMIRAHWEGRLELTEERLVDGEQACWDAVARHDPS